MMHNLGRTFAINKSARTPAASTIDLMAFTSSYQEHIWLKPIIAPMVAGGQRCCQASGCGAGASPWPESCEDLCDLAKAGCLCATHQGIVKAAMGLNTQAQCVAFAAQRFGAVPTQLPLIIVRTRGRPKSLQGKTYIYQKLRSAGLTVVTAMCLDDLELRDYMKPYAANVETTIFMPAGTVVATKLMLQAAREANRQHFFLLDDNVTSIGCWVANRSPGHHAAKRSFARLGPRQMLTFFETVVQQMKTCNAVLASVSAKEQCTNREGAVGISRRSKSHTVLRSRDLDKVFQCKVFPDDAAVGTLYGACRCLCTSESVEQLLGRNSPGTLSTIDDSEMTVRAVMEGARFIRFVHVSTPKLRRKRSAGGQASIFASDKDRQRQARINEQRVLHWAHARASAGSTSMVRRYKSVKRWWNKCTWLQLEAPILDS